MNFYQILILPTHAYLSHSKRHQVDGAELGYAQCGLKAIEPEDLAVVSDWDRTLKNGMSIMYRHTLKDGSFWWCKGTITITGVCTGVSASLSAADGLIEVTLEFFL